MAANGKPHIHKFTIDVPLGVQNDLQARLGTTRWPEQLAGVGWEQGTNEQYLQELVEYWRKEFSWNRQQEWLNSHFNNHKLVVDGLNLHFAWHVSQDPNAVPLLLIHGWPGSFIEFHKIIPELVAGRGGQSFHVVTPSLPGFGFSEAPKRTGFGAKQAAHILDKLMRALGYHRYLAQGGDWGAIIGFLLGVHHSDSCRGLHTNMPLGEPKLSSPWTLAQYANFTYLPQVPLTLTESEVQGLQQTAAFREKGTGYQAIQKTKPQTLGYGLNDSPAGLAAWITEKFHGWTDCNGSIENCVSKDELLTNICIYWFSGSITSSLRIYLESMGDRQLMLRNSYNKTPTAASRFPKELYVLPKAWVEACNNLQAWTEHPKGGHFAALEQPEALLADMLAHYRTIKL